MRHGRLWGVAIAAAAIGLGGCDDDNTAMMQNDLTMTLPDLSVMPDAGEDMPAVAPATAQITVADVFGKPWIPIRKTPGLIATSRRAY